MYEKFLASFEKTMKEAGYVKINIPADLPCASKVALWAKEAGAKAMFYLVHDLATMDWHNFEQAKSHMEKAMQAIATRVSARYIVAFNILVGELDETARAYIHNTPDYQMQEHYAAYIGVNSSGLEHSPYAPLHLDKANQNLQATLRSVNTKTAAFAPFEPSPYVMPRPAPPPIRRTPPPPQARSARELIFAANKRKYPIFTIAILVINVVLLALMEWHGSSTNSWTLYQFGAVERRAMLYGGEWWRLVSSMFLHIGIMHLFMNSMWLILAGIRAELFFGHLKFLIIYFVGGIVGSFAMMITADPNTITIGAGASGAIFGLMGSMLAYMLITKRNIENFSFQSLGTMVLINVVFGFMIPGISNAAHIGGMIGGFIVGVLFTKFGKGARL